MPTMGTVPVSDGYRPALDGIRTIAVATVMVFHFRPGWLPGGFVGVDVFFVLSGYLITGLLRDELQRSGRVALGRFYARRVRRLLPAALLVIAATAAGTAWLADDLERQVVADDVLPAAFAWSNWHFLDRDTDYFAADTDLDPFSHFWSLAVEEQFYLVWPATLALAWVVLGRLGRRPSTTLAVVAATASTIGLGVWWSATDGTPVAAYYATWYRAAQLGVGAALAFARPRVAPAPIRRAAPALTGVGLAGVAAVTVGLDRGDPYPGMWGPAVTVATALAVAGLEMRPDTGPAQVLSWRPVVYLGTISYGLYLWHIPVAELLPRLGDRIDVAGLDRFASLIVATLALAAASAAALERPVRQSPTLARARPALVVAGALTVFAAGAGTAAAGLRTGGEVGSTGVSATDLAGAATDRPATYDLGCHGGQETPWVGEVCVRRPAPGRPVVAIVGDSHAGNWDSALLGYAAAADVEYRYATFSACPAVDVAWNERSQASACRRFRDVVVPELAQLGGDDLILVAFNWTQFVEDIAGADPGTADRRRADLEAAIGDLATRLGAGGARVALLSPIPQRQRGGPQCLADAAVADDCTEVLSGPSAEDELVAAAAAPALARGTLAAVVPIAPIVCPDGRCPAVIGGVVTYRDREHLTQAFGAQLAEPLARALDQSLGWPA